jgi:DNA-binding transcriptional ArsR family regulator
MAMNTPVPTTRRDLEAPLKAAADPTRLRILALLRSGPLCVCQIVAVLGASQPAVSRHLALLRRAALIEAERRGRWVWYRRARAPRRSPRAALLAWIDRSLAADPGVRRDRSALRSARVRRLVKACPAPPPRAGAAARRMRP